MKLELLTAEVPKIQPFLESILQDGGKNLYSVEGEVLAIRNNNGMSGFEYKTPDAEGTVAVGIILGGTGYALRRTLRTSNEMLERFDYFNLEGFFTFTSEKESLKVQFVDSYEMDLTCPILNHLYNFLCIEYQQAAEGKSHTHQVRSVERFLQTVYKSKSIRLPVKDRASDPAIAKIYQMIVNTELDDVLTWEERHLVFGQHRLVLDKIVNTKVRAHKLSKASFNLALLGKNFGNFFERFLSRPASNMSGLLYRYTIGKIIWFFQTVKNNLGYSVALAVYGPFTYYFITMPMNPHAMQAVGRVREAYLNVKTEISELMDKGSVAVNDMSSKEARADAKVDPKPVTDSVSTKNAAPAKAVDTELPHVIYQSKVTTGDGKPMMIGTKYSATPSLLNMLVSTDVDKVNAQSWVERMSNFKQMQIGYEENIEYASRMGRLEQLETQYNFAMQVESTWEELERYNSLIFKLRAENPNMSAKMKQFLFNEINRTQQLELYLWDRMSRFVLDQIYVMLDQDQEQKRSDYYVGRSFVFLQEMTNILSWRYKDFKKPEGYDKIQKLADFYSKNRKEQGTVLKNLTANSDLFKQKDTLDTKEFRSYMKRQWEILFLQNSKAEEASNMGLNMYIWSVRNTIWVLQSIYSAKREEIALLIQRDISGKLYNPAELLARGKISLMYETFLHNLTLEYVGIREEIKNRLGKDIESNQRMIVIDNLKEFLTDREKLDGVNLANNQKTAGAAL
ncbi:MAG TPA: hypothetical protein VNJ01_15720 [Bacteriovoracaceae bacterium]|nr:hypothetical protein [Bacteriovoracaceae bacterium]